MKQELELFPDLIHLIKIREHLWCNREFGKASVMVGAGFSRNAQRTTSQVPIFPLWTELGATMYKELHYTSDLSSNSDNKEMLIATSGNGTLKLASEYEATFGRLALEQLLLKTIPDQDYQPSQLHTLLLSLPWADIFTTNYDQS